MAHTTPPLSPCNMLEDRELELPFPRFPQIPYVAQLLPKQTYESYIWKAEVRQRWHFLLFPLASRDKETLVFLWQCSGGSRVWHLFLWVPGTSVLMGMDLPWSSVPGARSWGCHFLTAQLSGHSPVLWPLYRWALLGIIPGSSSWSLSLRAFQLFCKHVVLYIKYLWV